MGGICLLKGPILSDPGVITLLLMLILAILPTFCWFTAHICPTKARFTYQLRGLGPFGPNNSLFHDTNQKMLALLPVSQELLPGTLSLK